MGFIIKFREGWMDDLSIDVGKRGSDQICPRRWSSVFIGNIYTWRIKKWDLFKNSLEKDLWEEMINLKSTSIAVQLNFTHFQIQLHQLPVCLWIFLRLWFLSRKDFSLSLTLPCSTGPFVRRKKVSGMLWRCLESHISSPTISPSM